MRLVIGGGGSGGHIFPGLAVAGALRSLLREELELVYMGRAVGVEAAIATDAKVPFATISARPLRGRHVFSQGWATLVLAYGVIQALLVLRRFRPDVVFVTGGYVSVPVGVAAWLLQCPLVVFLPDIEPGWAVRLLARLATIVCVTHSTSIDALPVRKTVATGYPLRAVFQELDRPMARARFQLNGSPTLLVTAAVQGSRTINDAISAQLDKVLETAHVIHVTGPRDEARLRARRDALPVNLRTRYHVFGYLGDDLPVAMVAADLAIARAGASVLGEFPAAGLPAVLVPLPEAGAHQRRNAAILEDAGAAIVLDNANVATELLPTTLSILQDEDRLTTMRQAAHDRARSDSAERIAELLWEARR